MILKNYCQLDGEEFDEEKVKLLINQYTEARMRDVFLRGEFNDKVKDKYKGHLYLKVFKEKIMSELNLDKQFDVTDIAL